MATGAAVTETKVKGFDQKAIVSSWNLGNADTGVAVENASFADRSVQIGGTYGSATVVIEGSNDGTNYVTLTDVAGNALSFTSGNVIKQILQVTKYIRAKTSGGSGTNLNVTLLVVRK